MSPRVDDKENLGLEFEFELNFESSAGCRTPRHREITAGVCPPAPRKKRVYASNPSVVIPKGGFFKPPDLESIFAPLEAVKTREKHFGCLNYSVNGANVS